MAFRMRLNDLARMSDADRAQTLTALVQAARQSNAATINAQIHALELRYEMTSAEMIDKLNRGELRETAELSQWLYLIDARRTCVQT